MAKQLEWYICQGAPGFPTCVLDIESNEKDARTNVLRRIEVANDFGIHEGWYGYQCSDWGDRVKWFNFEGKEFDPSKEVA